MINEMLAGHIINQAPTLGPAHEQICAHAISQGAHTRRVTNSYLCKRSTKKACYYG
jgi:hypothetical protein